MIYTGCCIIPGTPEMVGGLAQIWELSVRATHTFLKEEDIRALRPLVKQGIQEIGKLYCAVDSQRIPEAFMGIEGDKLEMLFVHPANRGKGVGKNLVKYAVKNLDVRYVDVNEQNPQAVGFYEHLGFRCFGRSELDGQGNPFPILHLRLKV